MNISVFRIDDRLIHGQIVTAWVNYADAKQIVVADDKASKDEFQQTLLKMATPKSVELYILNIDEAVKMLSESDNSKQTLLLVRGPKEALALIDACKDVKSINVGNLNMKKGKTKVLGNLWVEAGDVTAFGELNKKGITTEVRAVPNDKSLDVIELLKKEKLI